ncbi:MAG: Outer membrane efflux protein BepC [Alphaproteobacteria bacterium]|nr:MAG: Outer membrane efflux protein BepC [Alphaproteobacteria bacterium]
MKTIKTILASLSLFFALTGAAFAVSLEETLSQTLARNPALAAASSTYDARYKEQFVTLSDMLPQVTAFVTETQSDTETENYRTGEDGPSSVNGELNTDSYGLQVTQQLFTSGKNLNAFRSKRAEVKAEQAKLVSTEQQIFLGAVAAHLDVIEARSVLELREKNLNVLEKQLEAVQDRFSVGVVTRTDVAQSRAAAAGAKSAKLGAEAALRGAEAVYREVVGIPPAALENPVKLPRLPRSLEKAIQTARRENPDLKNAQEMSKSGRYTSYSTVGSVLPQINLTGRYSKTEDPSLLSKGMESEVTSVQMTLTVPIFLGGKSIAISASRDFSNALKQNVHVASNTVEREVIIAWNNMQATKSAIDATQEQIKASELALEGVRQENTLGTRTNLDVLNAEQLLLDARVALVQAERNQYVAAYNLLATTGRLTAKRLRIEAADISGN